MPRFDPSRLDEGIREIVLLLRKAGYKTFTSCEGGRGRPFPEPTVGLEMECDYFTFRDRLVRFLQSHGRRFFEVTLMSSYHQDYPERKHYVYLQGFDIASPEKRRTMLRAIQAKERGLVRRLERDGLGEVVEAWREERRRFAVRKKV